MRLTLAMLLWTALSAPLAAQTSPDFPTGRTVIIQLTSAQSGSGLGEYLVPPLGRALRRTGLRYRGDARADFVATVENRYDVGSWHGSGGGRVWLYERLVTVGLSPADVDVEPQGRLSPSFGITVRLLTPDADRVDELECLIALAVRELKARYRPQGSVVVNGQGCART